MEDSSIIDITRRNGLGVSCLSHVWTRSLDERGLVRVVEKHGREGRVEDEGMNGDGNHEGI